MCSGFGCCQKNIQQKFLYDGFRKHRYRSLQNLFMLLLLKLYFKFSDKTKQEIMWYFSESMNRAQATIIFCFWLSSHAWICDEKQPEFICPYFLWFNIKGNTLLFPLTFTSQISSHFGQFIKINLYLRCFYGTSMQTFRSSVGFVSKDGIKRKFWSISFRGIRQNLKRRKLIFLKLLSFFYKFQHWSNIFFITFIFEVQRDVFSVSSISNDKLK